MAFKPSSFDAVFVVGVLHHMDINQVSSELYHVLKKGGIVVCYEPLKYGPVMWAIRKIWLRLNDMKEYDSTEDEEPLEEKDFEPFVNIFRTSYIRKFNFIEGRGEYVQENFGSARWLEIG